MTLRTLTEAAELLGVSRRRLRAGIDAGRYPAYHWSNRMLVDVDALAPILAEEQRKRENHEGRIGLRECAEAIGLKPATLRRMARAGLVPCEKDGPYYRFVLAEVEATIRLGMK